MNKAGDKKTVKKNKWTSLRLSLRYRPRIIQLIHKMRQGIRRRNAEIKSLKHRLNHEGKISQELPEIQQENNNADSSTPQLKLFKDASSQTIENFDFTNPQNNKENLNNKNQNNEAKIETQNTIEADSIIHNDTKQDEKNDSERGSRENKKSSAEQTTETVCNGLSKIENNAGWNINDTKGNDEKSITEQVKEAAQSVLQESGMVYVESAGMYYDYKTGYYYNPDLGLYYHTDTNCYYYYSDDKQFVFHSYPDTSNTNTQLIAHQMKKARKQLKRERKPEDDIENLTKTLSQDKKDAKKAKRQKTKKTKNELSVAGNKDENQEDKDSKKNDKSDGTSKEFIENGDGSRINNETDDDVKNEKTNNEESKDDESIMDVSIELEDGECSDSSSEDDESSSNASTASVEDEDSIAKHHPPCMRVIVRETDLPKLKVGSLFLITKDGGSVGREGEHHAILIKDHNVSRNHLDVRYDMDRRTYKVTDLGSKNGTILNGNRMSESAVISNSMDVLHGSTIQLGETKLLCHIHPGNDTCGHCEPGLLMETEEKEKKAAYTRTCSVKKQHELELARLKNIYAPKLLEIEETAYNDRAQTRRETVGSSHHSVKTETTDLDTTISTENKGFKLLQKMGWSKGEGLGKDSQGDTEPVPLVSNDGKAGLGTTGAVSAPPLVPKPRPKNTFSKATLRLAARTKMLQPPAKAFQRDDDDEDDLE